jgi:hypothetical protein
VFWTENHPPPFSLGPQARVFWKQQCERSGHCPI